MTQVYVISGIIILVSILVCIVFVRQTVVKRKKERLRLQKALDKRSKNLIQMLSSFPPHFLAKDLTLFIYRCITNVFEQLTQLAPNEDEYLENLSLYNAQMEAVVKTAVPDTTPSIESSSQINELRQNLNHLGRFIQRSHQIGNINAQQQANYKSLLKNLIAQLMVDNYTLSAKGAIEIKKNNLASHYYTLAKNLITKEGLAPKNKEHLEFINNELDRLAKLALKEETEEGQDSENDTADEDAILREGQQWQQFKEDDSWKKKNVYD